MKLAGDLAEFSLADLVQVAGIAGRTCCVRVLAADGNGTLYLQGGEVVSAVFENLSGFDAFVALVAARAGHFQVENGAVPEQRTMQGNVQKLLLEANTRIEGGDVPKALRRPLPGPLPRAAATPAATGTPRPASTAGRRLWIGVAAALLLAAAASWLAFARHDASAGTGNAPGGGGAAVEATQLTGPRDALPALTSGRRRHPATIPEAPASSAMRHGGNARIRARPEPHPGKDRADLQPRCLRCGEAASAGDPRRPDRSRRPGARARQPQDRERSAL